jgi:FkbM family methyltransferase
VYLRSKFLKSIELLSDPRAIGALATWPRFSLSSYKLVSNLLRQGIVPRTVIDVGANVGGFAVAASRLMARPAIHCFEPLPQCVTQLHRNLLHITNASIYPLALGDTEGEAAIHVNSFAPSSSILKLGSAHLEQAPEAREIGSIPIRVTTLDAVFASIDLQPMVLLKLDTQGYESRVIRGGAKTLNRIDYVVLETSFKPLYEGEATFLEVESLMKSHGFRFLRPVGWYSDRRTDEILQMDALFQRQPLS